MTQPALMQGTPQSAVRECKDRWMEGTVQILVSEIVGTCPRARTSIDASHDGRAQHHVWGIAVIEPRGEASQISDDATTHDEHGLVASNGMSLERLEDFPNSLHAFAGLHAAAHELVQRDVVHFEVSVNAGSEKRFHLFIHNSNTTAF